MVYNQIKLIGTKIKKNMLKISLLLIFTIALFWFIFSKISFKETMLIILNSDFYLLFASLILLALSLVFYIIRWKFLIKIYDKNVSNRDIVTSFFAGFPLNSFLPSKMGDLVKAIYFKNLGTTKIIGTIVTERILDLGALVLFLMMGALFLNEIIFVYLAIIAVICIILGCFVLIKLPKLFKFEFFHKLSHSLQWLVGNLGYASFLFALSLLAWFLSFVQIYFLFLAVGVNVPFFYFVSGIVIAIVISMIPVTIAGMGTRETAIIYLFSQFGSNQMLLAAGLLFSFFRYWLLSLIGLPFFWKVFHRD